MANEREDLLRFYEAKVPVAWYSCGILQGRRLSVRLSGNYPSHTPRRLLPPPFCGFISFFLFGLSSILFRNSLATPDPPWVERRPGFIRDQIAARDLHKARQDGAKKY